MDTAKMIADCSDATAASAPVSPKSAAPADGRKTPEPNAAAAPSAAAAICTASHSRKRPATDEWEINLPQALKLIRKPTAGAKNPLEELEKKVCCRFEVEERGWNRFVINMMGTEVGLPKGRQMLAKMIGCSETGGTKRGRLTQSDAFPFMRLPVELQEMVVARVPNVDSRYDSKDGRGLLPLRLVNSHFKRMADKVLTKGTRRCFKHKIYLGEGCKGPVRLGFSPLQSKVQIQVEQVDQLLSMVTCEPPSGVGFKGFTEIGLKCDFRPSWCKQMLNLLLKHSHLQPDCLIVRGVLCESQMYREFVNSRPELQALIFEKPLGTTKVYDNAAYLPFFKSTFNDLGPQFDSPQNVRKNYNLRYVYSRKRRDFEFVKELLI